MKKLAAITLLFVLILSLCSCKNMKLDISSLNTLLYNELKTANRIVFVNNKENTLRFTVSDPKVIQQIAGVLSKSKAMEGNPGVDPDYTITFYQQNGRKRDFSYWMGASENNKTVNLKDENGSFSQISESLDVYIVSSTKMSLKPKFFVDLYSKCLSECISLLEPDNKNETIVGVDVTSDRRMRRYTTSYETERLFNSIESEGYTILPWSSDGKFTYEVTYVTNIYNPDKARITVEAIKTSDKTKQIFIFEAALENDRVWVIKRASNGS